MTLSQHFNYGNYNLGAMSGYMPFIGTLCGDTSSEDNVKIRVRSAGVFRYLYGYCWSAPMDGTSSIRLRKNNANTANVISWTGGQSGIKEYTSTGITYAATDYISYSQDIGDATFSISALGMSYAPTAATNVEVIVGVRGPKSLTGSGVVSFNAMNGDYMETSTEEYCAFSASRTLVASKLFVNVSTSNIKDDVLFGTRVNGVDGNQIITYSAGQSGIKEDTTHTDSIDIGDDFNFYTYAAFKSDVTVEMMKCNLIKVAAGQTFFPMMASSTDGVSIDFNSTKYCPSAGDLTMNATEADTSIRPRFTFVAGALGAYVISNTIATSATVVRVRDNGVNSAVLVSFAAAQTGIETNNVNTTSIATGVDKMNYSIVTPNTSGSITFSYIGLLSKAEGLSRNLFVMQAVNRASTY